MATRTMQAAVKHCRTLAVQAHKTFQDTLVFDDRRPDSPTRRLGLKPNCNKCTDGMFTDQYTATKVC